MSQSAPVPNASLPRAAIEISHVTKDFGLEGEGRVRALDGIDLVVDDGEFLCLVGPSGCGKSTLLRLVAGLVRPSSGEIVIHRRREGHHPAIATVFQDYSLYPWLTVERNVRFGLDICHVPKDIAVERSYEWLARVGLTGFETKYPAQLSGGMRQRLGLARALVMEPEILLMDEPFAALDAQLRRILQEELLRLWQEEKRTVVFVTHSLEEAVLLGDRIVLMSAHPGRVRQAYRVPFTRPRTPDLMRDKEFVDIQATIWDDLRSEVISALAVNSL